MAQVSNATLKMLELLAIWPLLPPPALGADIRAFFNAELPGAFVLATHHAVRTTRPTAIFRWLASSYVPEGTPLSASGGPPSDRNPAGPRALGDQYAVWREHRENWLMGPACNGDLTKPSVVCALANAVHDRYPPKACSTSGATLYTSDAGLDVSCDYNNQETITALLNFGQAICGLLSLAVGGAYATKMYTFFTPFSRGLIALVASYFEEAAVVKPLASRPVNSEVYLVGRGFRGISPEAGMELLGVLGALGAAGTPAGALVDPASYEAVDKVLLAAAAQIHSRRQVDFLSEAASLHRRYPDPNLLARQLRPEALRAQDAWLSRHRPLPILSVQRLVSPPATEGPEGTPGPDPGQVQPARARGRGRGRRGRARGRD